MKEYQPTTPFNVAGKYYICTGEAMVKGVLKKTYDFTHGETFYCSFRSFGGTEVNSNGITFVENTVIVETWYDPSIKADTIIEVDGCRYEIIGVPENISMRNKWLKFKVREVKGGA